MIDISVIVPIYGVEKYLRECLDSIINQTFKNLEIILIDDGSKDKCPQICDEYAAKDERIQVIHKENSGYAHSCNVGLDIARGAYISIIEPDDFIDKDMFMNLYKLATHNNADIVKSCFFINKQIKYLHQIKKENFSDEIPQDRIFTIKEYPYFLKDHPSIWSCIYKREFLNDNKIRFIEVDGTSWIDNPFQVATMCLAKRICYTQEAYYYYRVTYNLECEKLKDYRIPFNRSDEIFQWLNKNNINDKGILACLWGREITYIEIALGSVKYGDYKHLSNLIKKCLDRMDSDILENSKYIKNSTISKYKSFKNNLYMAFLAVRFHNARKNLISIKIRKQGILVRLFGISFSLRQKKSISNTNDMR